MDSIEILQIAWKGLLSAVLISLSSSVIGVYLLIKRLSMLGAGLSHAAFGGIAIALVLGLDVSTFTLIYTVLLGLAIQYLIQKRGLPADTLLSLAFSFGVAVAIIILSLWSVLGLNIFSYLFGSMLLASETELLNVLLVSLITLIYIAVNYRSILVLLFNEEMAKLRGIKVERINYILIALACANIVISIKAVGIILSASFISIPPMASLLLAQSFFSALLISVLFSLTSTLLGMGISLVFDIPPGGSIVISMVLLFLALLSGRLIRKIFPQGA